MSEIFFRSLLSANMSENHIFFQYNRFMKKENENHRKKSEIFISLAKSLDKIEKHGIYYSKGKPVEKQGRKAKGLRSRTCDYDSRLPH